jgi:regulator of protease activity HflC (stomatin/prohibitin superfamily)
MSTISSLVVVLLVIARAIVIATVCTCNQYQRAAVFFLGRYSRRFLEWRRA